VTTFKEIKKEKQLIAQCEKSLALGKLKQRKSDTRHKIELGGLVIKSGMRTFSKSIILGALTYSIQLIEKDSAYVTLFEAIGNQSFLAE
jgi:hypothetical protein